MRLQCNKVTSLPRAPLRITEWKKTSSNKSEQCSFHQTLGKSVPYCMTVNSYKLSDYIKANPGKNIKYPEQYIDCAAFNQEQEMNEFSCSFVRGYYDEAQNYAYLSNTISCYVAYKEDDPVSEKSLVKHQEINDLRNYLIMEFDRRKKHIWYKTSIGSSKNITADVESGDQIMHPQQSNLFQVLSNIKNQIARHDDRKKLNAQEVFSKEVKRLNLVETDNLRLLESDLFNSGVDCICYSDCTAFQLGQSRTCTCNINCLCNYS